jgi:tetratricopeptide (TPR) repeat protein
MLTRHRRLLAICIAAAWLALGPLSSVSAHQGRQSLVKVAGLGSISFPNSGNTQAQAPFVRGVLLLHSFEYEPAAEAFRAAQKSDPGFALAYWGEAMTYNHPLWQQQNRDAAIKALERLGPTASARAAKAPTERERLYLSAVEALYGEGTKQERDQAYMRAMAKLSDTEPADDEARTFYALAILGSRDGTRDFATYMRAAAVAQPVFERNPDHPGAAHYLIHSFDDPIHAPLGIPAARKYSSIAPGAAHAQHMTTHIFVALGMWDDVIAANLRAIEGQNADNAKRGRPAAVCGHYPSWLQYGYLMKGDAAKAASMLDACYARSMASSSAGETGSFVSMRARQILDTEDWALAAKWTWTPGVGTGPALVTAFEYNFTNAFAALRRGDAAPARTLVAGSLPADPTSKIHIQELRGLVAIADGKVDQGLQELRAAAAAEDAAPFEFGPPAILKPTFELLAEELARAGKSADAAAAYAKAAERTPGRRLLKSH